MIDKINGVFKRKFMLDFHEIPGEMLDEVNGIKISRYLYVEDAEELELDLVFYNSADFSDGDEPDDNTGIEDFDEVKDYICFDEIADSLEIEEDEEADYLNFDIEYLEITRRK